MKKKIAEAIIMSAGAGAIGVCAYLMSTFLDIMVEQKNIQSKLALIEEHSSLCANAYRKCERFFQREEKEIEEINKLTSQGTKSLFRLAAAPAYIAQSFLERYRELGIFEINVQTLYALMYIGQAHALAYYHQPLFSGIMLAKKDRLYINIPMISSNRKTTMVKTNIYENFNHTSLDKTQRSYINHIINIVFSVYHESFLDQHHIELIIYNSPPFAYASTKPYGSEIITHQQISAYYSIYWGLLS